MQMRDDLIRMGYRIPDVRTFVSRTYTAEDVAKAKHIYTCDLTGEVCAELATGELAHFYGMDLD
jgi:hypothetical protein